MSQSRQKAMAEGSLEGSRSVESPTPSTAREGPQCSGGVSAARSEYFSGRIQSVIKSSSEYETAMEAEIESSKAHWSELAEVECDKQRCLEADKAFFRSLLQQYVGSEEDGFFLDFSEDWSEHRPVLGEQIAEGAQGAIYILQRAENLVMKVFKLEEGFNLEALHKQWPPAMLKVVHNHKRKVFDADNFSRIYRGVLLEDGRFGFVMPRYWGDLRKMIDKRMIHNGNQASPFSVEVYFSVMYEIALGMRALHRHGIVHGDLKASNVLIQPNIAWNAAKNTNPAFDPLQESAELSMIIADFECSIGVVGTRFWRAPEILFALKNRCFVPNLCTEKSDVYSFAMTCYEVMTGKIPLEEERSNNYDIVLGGKRPDLPSDIYLWVRSMLERCWHHEPSERPSFEEIVEKFIAMVTSIRESGGKANDEIFNVKF